MDLCGEKTNSVPFWLLTSDFIVLFFVSTLGLMGEFVFIICGTWAL